MTVFQDKKAIFHVFAGLMNQPYKLEDTENHKLTIDDFPERFHRIVFSAITNLFEQGVEKINAIEVDGYLSRFPEQYYVFNENNGFDYLTKSEEIGEPENFDYHLNRIKKYSFLRECKVAGIDISNIFDENLINPTEEEVQQAKFDEMTLDEMMNDIDLRLIGLKDKFLFESVSNGSHMSDNMEEMLELVSKEPSYGLPTPSLYLNTISRGLRKRKLYIFSGNSGSGKTRMLLAMMLNACVPEIFDRKQNKWIKTGATEGGLFISTELEEIEIKIPALCFIADVPEDKVNDGLATEEELMRLKKAAQIYKETNIRFEELHDFDLEDLEHVITKNIHQYGIGSVFFDYLHTTLKLFDSMAKQGAKNMQEHQVLRMMSIRLKNMCNKHNIFMASATQLNENHKLEGNMDQSSIEGSKSIVNKIDLGAIQLPLSVKDEKIIDTIMETGMTFGTYPTHTINIYKNRGGKHKNVRIFFAFNLGTLRMEDVFVTNYKNELLTDIPKKQIEFKNQEEIATEEEDELPDVFFEEPVKMIDF